jgi:hypothetical protein
LQTASGIVNILKYFIQSTEGNNIRKVIGAYIGNLLQADIVLNNLG